MNTQSIATNHVVMKGIVGTVIRKEVAVMKEIEGTIIHHRNIENLDDSMSQEAMELMHIIGINISADFGM